MAITPLTIQQLVKPDIKSYTPLQTDYFEAYRSHKKAAECLIRGNLPREAFLSLNIAAECLLKGIYDCVKFYYFGKKGSKNQLRLLVEKNISKDIENHLDAKNFNHKINELSKIIFEMFDEFRNGAFTEDYGKLSTAMAQTEKVNFTNERYNNPNLHPKEYWSENSKRLLDALNSLENKALSALFKD